MKRLQCGECEVYGVMWCGVHGACETESVEYRVWSVKCVKCVKSSV